MKKYIPESLKRAFRIFRSLLFSLYSGFPSKDLRLIGVTGTSGKSTTAHMIYHLLNENGFKIGLISTVAAKIGEEELDTGFHVTTPDPIQLQRILKMMKEKGVEYVVLETSSHALAQGRLGVIKFDYAVYTNITSDHLDWHKTWENYAEAKSLLIDKLKKDGKVILNLDDKKSIQFLRKKAQGKNIKTLEYSKNDVENIKSENGKIEFRYDAEQFNIPIIGEYNIENILASMTLGDALSISSEQARKAFETFHGLPGRMEVMQKNPFWVIVDFAHNTDSLKRSLLEARKLIGKDNRLIVVFGSAGLRDQTRRAPMGKVAAEIADVVILTAEDPRIESLHEINSQILKGAKEAGGELVKRFSKHEEYESFKNMREGLDSKAQNSKRKKQNTELFVFDEESVSSRYDAIDLAVHLAGEGDLVITEGKGHEQSLCFGKTEYPFTDQDAVRKALRK